MDKLILFPCNGNTIEALDCLGNSWEPIAFIDDQMDKQGTMIQDIPVFDRSILTKYPDAKVLAIPGSPTSYLYRQKHILSLNISENRFAKVIHPSAQLGRTVKIGYNVLIMGGVQITSNAIIHNHVCILPNSVVHHDSIIYSYVLIGGLVCIAGGVQIEENAYIGSGSSIMNGLVVGKNSLIGLGSTVIKNTPPNTKVAGCPAKILA